MRFSKGDSGPEIRDIQQRLVELGLLAPPEEPGTFDDATVEAVRILQQRRRLAATGVVNDDTWRALVEAGWRLGDRLLYETSPMLRGDDVRELQRRLTRLGFDTTWIDGVFGARTAEAVRDFQENAGLKVDGRAGPITIEQLQILERAHQRESVTGVRERHRMGPNRLGTLAGLPILVDPAHGPDSPGHTTSDGLVEHEITWAVASLVAGRLSGLGAWPILSRGPSNTPSTLDRTELANRKDVAAILSIHVAGADSMRQSGTTAWYFGDDAYVSPRGQRLAELCVDRVVETLGTPHCRAHPSTMAILSASRAPAVAIELGFLTNPHDASRLADPAMQRAVADALVDALVTYVTEEV